MITSNLSHPSAQCVNSVADDDPFYSPSILDNGRGSNEFDLDNDDLEDDSYARPIALELNAIDIPRPAFVPSYDVQSATSDDDDDVAPVAAAIPFAVASSKMKEVTNVEGNDPEAPRAQIDTGAFVSCTDQQHLLHQYREFSREYPCPVTLLVASEGSNIVPKGAGYLHVLQMLRDTSRYVLFTILRCAQLSLMNAPLCVMLD